jgi:hypothetical protein
MRKILITTVLLLAMLLVSPLAWSQEVLPLAHQLRLANYQLEWVMPADAHYRFQRYPIQAYQDYDFSLEVRKKKLQIRYLLQPADQEEDRNPIPHLRAGAMAMHLASNEDDSYVAAHQLDSALVDSVYQADWAQTFFFQPKDAFSLAPHCQMTVIYREGVALAYIFLLFEEAPADLASYAESLHFRPRLLAD